MAYGLQIFNSSGQTVLDTSDRTGQLLGVVEVYGQDPTLRYQYVPPIDGTNNELWVYCQGYNFDNYWEFQPVWWFASSDTFGYYVNRAPSGAVTQFFYGWK